MTDGKLLPAKICTRMFHQGRCHMNNVKYVTEISMEFFYHSFLYMGYICYDLYKHRKLLYGTKNISREMPDTTAFGGNGHTGKLEYQLKQYSFRTGPPRKMKSSLILVLAKNK